MIIQCHVDRLSTFLFHVYIEKNQFGLYTFRSKSLSNQYPSNKRNVSLNRIPRKFSLEGIIEITL